MFGFMPVPCCGCASSAERRDYRALSCGLCNVLSRTYGLHTRFLVNRDAAFLHMLFAALMPEPPTTTTTTCCNPLGAKHPLFQTGPAVEFAAAVTICGVQAKLEDDIADKNRFGSLAAKTLLQANRSRFTKAHSTLAHLRFPTQNAFKQLKTQSSIEADILHSRLAPKMASEPTAVAFGTIISHAAVLTDSHAPEPLYTLGHALGNLIYWLDAVVDYADDVRRDHFNPIWSMTREPILTQAMLKSSAMPLIDNALQRVESATSELTLHRFQPLIHTLLSTGIQGKVHQSIHQAVATASHNSELIDDEETQKHSGYVAENTNYTSGYYCDPSCCNCCCSSCECNGGSDCCSGDCCGDCCGGDCGGDCCGGDCGGCDCNGCDGGGCDCGGCDCNCS